MSKKHLVPLNIYASTTQPSGTNIGDAYFDYSQNVLKVFNGSIWITFSGSSSNIDEIIFIDGGTPTTNSYSLSADAGLPDTNHTDEYDGGGVWDEALFPDGPPIDFYDGGIFSTVYTENLDAGAYNTVYTETGIDAGTVVV